MNIREISDVFKDTADEITAIKSYNFGWASDRVRQGNTEDFQELNEFPRVFFAVPTITGSDQTRKQDTYQVTLFFDDLLGYDNEGNEDPTLQIDKWANLQQYANYFIQRLNKIKQSILPNYLFIPEAPSITFDSFTGIQRMITVQLSFNLVVPTNCDPGIITLVQCIANIVTSSNLTASLKSIIKFAASLEGRATVTADIALVQKVASSLNAFGTLTGDINFVQKVQASLLTSSSVTGNIIIPKLVQASLTGSGTTAANLTVNAPSASLLLDLYPSAAVAYSLRKLRSAYTGSAIRVRASTSGAEGDVSFDVNSTISASSTVTVTAVGTSGLSIGQQVTFSTFWNAGGSNQNVFVTIWYDQSGNENNATQTTQANQPQIVSSGVIILAGSKPSIVFDGTNDSLSLVTTIENVNINSSHYQSFVGERGAAGRAMLFLSSSVSGGDYVLTHWDDNKFYFYANPTQIFSSLSANTNSSLSLITGQNNSNTVSIFINSTSIPGSNSDNLFTRKINTIGKYSFRFTNSKLSESVFYLSNQSTNRIGIETNINTHYGIY